MIEIDDIRKVSGKELLFSLFFVSGSACPGVLAIWLFAPKMVESGTVLMLLVLSLSVTIPIVSINSLAAIYAVFQSHEEKEFWGIFPVCIAVGSCAATVSLGVSVLLAFLFGFAIKTFVWTAIGGDSLFLGLCVLMGLSMYKAPTTTK